MYLENLLMGGTSTLFDIVYLKDFHWHNFRFAFNTGKYASIQKLSFFFTFERHYRQKSCFFHFFIVKNYDRPTTTSVLRPDM